jgi:hypothetical protein
MARPIMTADVGGRDGEVEALVVDRYLESILSRRPIDVDVETPPEMEATAVRLARDLPRYHPSFRFEEDLAARLAGVAARAGDGTLVPFPTRAHDHRAVDPRWRGGHPVVVGGVLTSAAISVIGAVLVAWRLRRPFDPSIAGRVRAALAGRFA